MQAEQKDAARSSGYRCEGTGDSATLVCLILDIHIEYSICALCTCDDRAARIEYSRVSCGDGFIIYDFLLSTAHED